MARQKDKIILIDKINELFIEIQSKELSKGYEKFFKAMQRKLSSIAKEDNLKLSDVKQIINDIPIDITAVKRTLLLSLLLSGLTNIIENQKLKADDKDSFLPVIALVALYGLKPDKIVPKLNQVSNAVFSNNAVDLTKRDKKAFGLIKEYFNTNEKFISKNIKEFEDGLRRINKEIRNGTSKSIFKRYKRLRNENISINQVSKELQAKFSDNQARIERIARTEIKRQVELVKITQHSALGYTHKRWNTQGDGKVSLSHQAMSGKVIEIDKKFHIPGIDRKPSAWVMYPGDTSAPVGQVVNERCFLTYIKR